MVANQPWHDKRWAFRCLALALALLFGCSPQRFFYYPNKTLYNDPDKMGVTARVVEFQSLNGKKLYGLFIPCDGKPKGVIVHFHGNYGNLSNHFPLALFLTKKGYDVLAFDYEGYGASEGNPTPKHLIDDGRAAVRYAYAARRDPTRNVAVFGQSLGGAVAIVVAAQEPEVKAAVIESAFAGYREMARAALRRSWITWPASFVIPIFVRTAYDPIRYVAKISPRPLLLIHGDADEVVPTSMSRELFKAAGDPKTLWIVPDAGHLLAYRAASDQYTTNVATFFDAALTPKSEDKPQTNMSGMDPHHSM